MRQRRLGDSDLRVSVLGLGTNNVGRRLDLGGTRVVVDAALEAGITLIDTADLYGDGLGEEYLGRALAGRRDAVVLASKFGWDLGDRAPSGLGPRGGRRYLRWAVEGSLRRLRTDRIDLYQYHCFDGVTPLAETIGALAELVGEGKVAYAGCSNLAAGQLAEAAALACGSAGRFVAAQHAYSVLDRAAEREVVPVCLEHGVGLIAYYPLANGLLTGKVGRGRPPAPGSRLAARRELVTEQALDAVEQLDALAAERGRTLLELALGALAAQPAVAAVVAGAMTPAQVRANAAAAAWEPSGDDLAGLDDAVPRGASLLVHPEFDAAIR